MMIAVVVADGADDRGPEGRQQARRRFVANREAFGLFHVCLCRGLRLLLMMMIVVVADAMVLVDAVRMTGC